LSGRRWVWGRQVYISALRLEDGELLVVISSDSPQTAISDYAKRWGIETLFGMFKTRGFCLESTHFTDSERLSKLIALMALAARKPECIQASAVRSVSYVLGYKSWTMATFSFSSQSKKTWATFQECFSLWVRSSALDCY
jgi:hypothetical protein